MRIIMVCQAQLMVALVTVEMIRIRSCAECIEEWLTALLPEVGCVVGLLSHNVVMRRWPCVEV